jgi:hypothetical protein
MMPYRSEWQDMSDYVVHFTRETENNSTYDNAMSILGSRVLYAAHPFGIARNHIQNPDVVSAQQSVCFSEIPLHLLERLSRRRGGYGVGFTKEFILRRGGNPIWYVEHGSDIETALHEIIQRARTTHNSGAEPIWELTPFIDARGNYPSGPYRFEWEREWRHVGDLHFEIEDVAFLIIPENLHDDARAFFQDALDENIGPAYFCPYIDIGWDFDRVRRALEEPEG